MESTLVQIGKVFGSMVDAIDRALLEDIPSTIESEPVQDLTDNTLSLPFLEITHRSRPEDSMARRTGWNVVVYHCPCFDGAAAAVVAERALIKADQALVVNPEFVAVAGSRLPTCPEMIPMTFGKFGSLPQNLDGKRAIFVDICPPLSIVLQLLEVCEDLLILDHHESSQEAMSEIPAKNKHFDMTKSGVMLAWDYFTPIKPLELGNPLENIPLIVQYIQDRDLWNWSLPESREFSAGYAEYKMLDHESATWFLDVDIPLCIEAGRPAIAFQREFVKRVTSRPVYARFKDWPQYQLAIVPAGSGDFLSEIGEALYSRPGIDIGVVYSEDLIKGGYRVSLRCKKDSGINTSLISRTFPNLYGPGFGGGHPAASGFTCPSLHDLLDFSKPGSERETD